MSNSGPDGGRATAVFEASCVPTFRMLRLKLPRHGTGLRVVTSQPTYVPLSQACILALMRIVPGTYVAAQTVKRQPFPLECPGRGSGSIASSRCGVFLPPALRPCKNSFWDGYLGE